MSQLDCGVSDRWLSLRESSNSFAERKTTIKPATRIPSRDKALVAWQFDVHGESDLQDGGPDHGAGRPIERSGRHLGGVRDWKQSADDLGRRKTDPAGLSELSRAPWFGWGLTQSVAERCSHAGAWEQGLARFDTCRTDCCRVRYCGPPNRIRPDGPQ